MYWRSLAQGAENRSPRQHFRQSVSTADRGICSYLNLIVRTSVTDTCSSAEVESAQGLPSGEQSLGVDQISEEVQCRRTDCSAAACPNVKTHMCSCDEWMA